MPRGKRAAGGIIPKGPGIRDGSFKPILENASTGSILSSGLGGAVERNRTRAGVAGAEEGAVKMAIPKGQVFALCQRPFGYPSICFRARILEKNRRSDNGGCSEACREEALEKEKQSRSWSQEVASKLPANRRLESVSFAEKQKMLEVLHSDLMMQITPYKEKNTTDDEITLMHQLLEDFYNTKRELGLPPLTDGEGIERAWAETAPMAPSSREKLPGPHYPVLHLKSTVLSPPLGVAPLPPTFHSCPSMADDSNPLVMDNPQESADDDVPMRPNAQAFIKLGVGIQQLHPVSDRTTWVPNRSLRLKSQRIFGTPRIQISTQRKQALSKALSSIPNTS
ncbi:hypothetical protein DFH06DRAFT_1130538 [Mycena polygramma]|nr:hypothetical protein DFH06DRAFT_1130538 [Mycena polygramma]